MHFIGHERAAKHCSNRRRASFRALHSEVKDNKPLPCSKRRETRTEGTTLLLTSGLTWREVWNLSNSFDGALADGVSHELKRRSHRRLNASSSLFVLALCPC
eukprot:2158382-Rhodomonas_salina.1